MGAGQTRVEKGDERRDVVGGAPLEGGGDQPPRAHARLLDRVLHQAHGLFIGKHVPETVGGQDQEFVLAGDERDRLGLWLGPQALVQQIGIPDCPAGNSKEKE